MIQMRNKRTGRLHSFFVVDAHQHIGVDEDGHENTPVGPTGSYAFFKKLLNGDGVTMGFADDVVSNPDIYEWEPANGKNPAVFSPLLEKFFTADEGLKSRYGFDQSILVDQAVVFPLHDKYRFSEGVEYRSCNAFIKKWCTTYPHSFRLIGFGRVNPTGDMKEAKKEIQRFVNEDGSRGLKLHPSSDEFLVQSNQSQEILMLCAELNIPVIFHTTYGSEVDKLHDGINKIILRLVLENKTHLIPRLRIIIGHCTYTSEEVFRALSHPNIYAELSVVNDAKSYLKVLRENVSIKKFFETTVPTLDPPLNTRSFWEAAMGPSINGIRWSHKVMFGTDHPFMPPGKYIEFLKALFMTETELNPEDIHNILGANAMRLIPPPQYKKGRISAIPPELRNDTVEDMVKGKRKFVCFVPLGNPLPLSSVRANESLLYYSEKSKDTIHVALHTQFGLKQISGKKKDFEGTVKDASTEEMKFLHLTISLPSSPVSMEWYNKLGVANLES